MLKIFNTYTRKKEIFQTINNTIINMYVCGVTVYDLCHIGHARTFIVFDIIVNYLRYIGYKVKYIRNITDIDDKIIFQSLEKKVDIQTFTDLMIQEMNRDFYLLGISPPDYSPRVTNYIDHIIKIIVQLIQKKSAYINNKGDVIFSIDSDRKYGSLSKQPLNQLIPGSRIIIDQIKKNPLDFVLWKKAKKTDKFYWMSPWGEGRPGWHIECTALINHFFKDSVDIHGGGSDLLFPHHENEISQSRCLTDTFKVNFWMHVGMVVVNDKKMSKSYGNSCFIRDILTIFHPEVLRYFLLSTHYRHPVYYSEENLTKSKLSLEYLYLTLHNINPIKKNISYLKNIEKEFFDAMNDDFNTPKALSILFKLSRKINYFKKIDFKKSCFYSFQLKKLACFLGILQCSPQEFMQKKYFSNINMIKKINSLVEKRDIARKLKKWKEADKLRNELIELDIILEDLPNQTLWRSKK